MDDFKVFSIAKMKKAEELFSVLDFPYALVKGDALSIQIYGEPGKRDYGDIDILLDRRDLKRIKLALSNTGFKDTVKNRKNELILLSSSHQVSPWVKNITPFGILEIDLNTNIFWGECVLPKVDMRDFLFDVVKTDIYGISINILPPVKALLHLILHHYKDMNSIYLLSTRNTIRKDKFYEIYFLLKKNCLSITPEKLYDVASKYNAVPFAYYIIYYTLLVVEDRNLLQKYVDILKCDDGVSLLDCYGLTNSERKKWRANFEIRLKEKDVFSLIKNDLTHQDYEKININNEIMSLKI